MMTKLARLIFIAAFLTLPLSVGQPAAGQPPLRADWQAKVEAQVLEQAAAGPAEFMLMLSEQADLSPAYQIEGKAAKGQYVYQLLTALAARTQAPLLSRLQTLKQTNPSLDYRSFWVSNMIWVRGDDAALQALASRPEVARVYANPQVHMDLPQPAPEPASPTAANAPEAIEWNITQTGAPQAWAKGYTGQGIVIGGQDTGYVWNHPALIGKYRGWNGVAADHKYNWHDAIHNGISSCPANSSEPCDDNGHGTHTMGTMVGDDGGSNQIGMAPGARWIGCRNMIGGVGTPATYSECYQWFIAPTDSSGLNPRPDLAPDVINNSWSCPTSEGCTDPLVMLNIVNAVRAAGIVTVHSAGNKGFACGTINEPAAIYDASFTVGATDSFDNITSFSSRGPVNAGGSGRIGPDISAPGANVRSSHNNGGYRTNSGTSMAAPHVAGLVALILDARPQLAGDVDTIERLIQKTALPRTTNETCGSVPGTQVPNNTYGYGRIDALKAVTATEHWIDLVKTPSSALYSPGGQITYTLQITHQGAAQATTNVVLSDTLPAGTSFVSATGPYMLVGNRVVWTWASIGPGESRSVSLVVQVQAGNTVMIVNQDYGVSSDHFPVLPEPEVVSFQEGMLIFSPLILR